MENKIKGGLMKIFLGVDITDKKNQRVYEANEFVTKKLSEISQQALDESDEQMEQISTKASLPKGLQIAFYVFGAIFLVCVVGLVRAIIGEITLAEAYQNAPFIFWIAGGAGVVTLGLFLYSRYRLKTVAQDQNTEVALSRQNLVVENALQELDIPQDAKEIDVYIFRYTMKDGKFAIKKYDFYPVMIPVLLKAYRNGNNLCLADITRVIEFPLDESAKITTINKSVLASEWTKDESPKTGRYAQYKIKSVQSGLLVKPYHVLHLYHNNEEICIYFPCYELPIIQQLTGIDKVEEEN